MPSWKTLEAKDRLLAALVAAHPDKKLLDYRRIATYYGQGTTYDAIEGQFRIIRREAEKLRQAVDSGEHAQAPPRGGGGGQAASAKPKSIAAKSRAPKKAGGLGGASGLIASGGVISGRITKSNSPPKMRKNAPISAAATYAAATLAPTPMMAPGLPYSENKINGVKEEAFSTDNSVIEIEDDHLAFVDPCLSNEDTTFASSEWNLPFFDEA